MKLLNYLFLVICFSLVNLSLTNAQTLSQLKPVHCGQQMTYWLGQQGEVYSTFVTGATHYKFKAVGTITDVNYISEKISAAIPSSTTSGAQLNIGAFGGMKDITWYTISVSWSSDNGLSWSNYGSSCQIKTCLSQQTQLQPGYCGIQALNWGANFVCYTRPFATQYRFRLKNLPGQTYFDQTALRNVNYVYWSNFLNVPSSKTFECYIQWNNGGDWKPWGTMCYITSPQLTLTQSTMPDRSVVGSAGRTVIFQSVIPTEKNQLSYTVGEPFTSTYVNTLSSRIITQGFQQPDKTTISLTQPGVPISGIAGRFTFNTYPNPFSAKITIVAPSEYQKLASVKVVSETGQLVMVKIMEYNHLEIDLTQCAMGKYFVVISDESGEIIDNISIVKSSLH